MRKLKAKKLFKNTLKKIAKEDVNIEFLEHGGIVVFSSEKGVRNISRYFGDKKISKYRSIGVDTENKKHYFRLDFDEKKLALF